MTGSVAVGAWPGGRCQYESISRRIASPLVQEQIEVRKRPPNVNRYSAIVKSTFLEQKVNSICIFILFLLDM